MTSEQALDVARTATSIAKASTDAKDPIGRKPGQVVSVTPDDTGRDPVIGELVTSGIHEIVIRRSDPAIGEVCVHFPRAGFVVTSPQRNPSPRSARGPFSHPKLSGRYRLNKLTFGAMGANRLHAYPVFTQFEGLAVSAFPAKLRLRIDVLDYRGAPIPAVRVTTI